MELARELGLSQCPRVPRVEVREERRQVGHLSGAVSEQVLRPAPRQAENVVEDRDPPDSGGAPGWCARSCTAHPSRTETASRNRREFVGRDGPTCRCPRGTWMSPGRRRSQSGPRPPNDSRRVERARRHEADGALRQRRPDVLVDVRRPPDVAGTADGVIASVAPLRVEMRSRVPELVAAGIAAVPAEPPVPHVRRDAGHVGVDGHPPGPVSRLGETGLTGAWPSSRSCGASPRSHISFGATAVASPLST